MVGPASPEAHWSGRLQQRVSPQLLCAEFVPPKVKKVFAADIRDPNAWRFIDFTQQAALRVEYCPSRTK
jgi:hypothetical protein